MCEKPKKLLNPKGYEITELDLRTNTLEDYMRCVNGIPILRPISQINAEAYEVKKEIIEKMEH